MQSTFLSGNALPVVLRRRPPKGTGRPAWQPHAYLSLPLLTAIGPSGWFGKTSPAYCHLERTGFWNLLGAGGTQVWVRLRSS